MLLEKNKPIIWQICSAHLCLSWQKVYLSNVICETAKQVLEQAAGKNGWDSNDEIVLPNT